jgi:basic membrane protein A
MFSLSACGSKPEEASNGGEETKEVTKVALLVSGSLGDKSFHDSSQGGIDLIKEKYGDKVVTKTIEMGSDKTKFIPTLEDVSEEDWDVIITGTFHMKEPIEEVAPNYPDKTYILFDTAVSYDEVEGLDNVYSILYKQNEAGFLAGVLAAQMTTATDVDNINPDKKIGFLGAMDIPVINDFLVGYIEGAKYIDEEIKVDISYIDSFSDAAKAKELAIIQYDTKGVDIGFNVAGRAGLGQIEAAYEKNTYAIGVDSDQALLFEDKPEKANKIASSALKRVDKSLLRALDMYFEGNIPTGKKESIGLEEGAIGLSKNKYYEEIVPKEIKDKVLEIEGKIGSGEIKVNSAFGLSSEEIGQLKESVK